MDLANDVHLNLKSPCVTNTTLIRGNYTYYHYVCDGFDDKGWGCGYRTLQTICSWIKKQKELYQASDAGPYLVPSILEIQKALVHIGDKSQTFVGSREWIGSIEVAYCIDYFYRVNCRIIHVRNLNDLKEKVGEIQKHFKEFGSPIMMGGDQDCSSKCVLGISISSDAIWLLILDPHYVGHSTSKDELRSHGWIRWQLLDSLIDSSFYNLCYPLLKAKY